MPEKPSTSSNLAPLNQITAQLDQLIAYYNTTKADCPILLEKAQHLLHTVKEETGWKEFDDSFDCISGKSEPVISLEELQRLLAHLLEDHSLELEKNITILQKKGDYVPQLIQITQDQVKQEYQKIRGFIKNLCNALELEDPERMEKITRLQAEILNSPTHLDLLQEEIHDNFPEWGTHLTGYAIHKPYCEVLCRWLQTTLTENMSEIEKTLKELQNYKHPFIS